MRTPLKLAVAALAAVGLAVGAAGAVSAIGTDAAGPAGGAWSAPDAAARTATLAQEAEAQQAIEFAAALHEQRLTDYALVVYLQEVEKAEAAAAAAAAAAAQAQATTTGGGAGGNLAAIRACESGGNYAANTGNGYYGAYQFDQQTWNSVGGTGNPADASPAEQDARAQALLDSRGTSPWPSCG